MTEKSFSEKILMTSKFGSQKKLPKKSFPFRTIIIAKDKNQNSNPITLKNTSNNTDYNNSDYSKLENISGFITQVPVDPIKSKKIGDDLNLYKSLPKIKVSMNKKFQLLAYNDEKCFVTSRPQKQASFPKKYTILKKYRICHDINNYNINNYICDYMKDYEKNSYKIKKLVEDSKFLNKIKKDLITLKYDRKIKPFNE